MVAVTTSETDVHAQDRPWVHPALRLFAPVLAAGAVWTARFVINRAYQKASGHTPPIPSDPRTTWRRAIAWTALTATTAAVIEVAVHRVANERLPRRRPAVEPVN
jgi:type 1 glutamine amidotransferase